MDICCKFQNGCPLFYLHFALIFLAMVLDIGWRSIRHPACGTLFNQPCPSGLHCPHELAVVESFAQRHHFGEIASCRSNPCAFGHSQSNAAGGSRRAGLVGVRNFCHGCAVRCAGWLVGAALERGHRVWPSHGSICGQGFNSWNIYFLGGAGACGWSARITNCWQRRRRVDGGGHGGA